MLFFDNLMFTCKLRNTVEAPGKLIHLLLSIELKQRDEMKEEPNVAYDHALHKNWKSYDKIFQDHKYTLNKLNERKILEFKIFFTIPK